MLQLRKSKSGDKIVIVAATETALFGQYFVKDDKVDGGGVWFDAMWDRNTGKIENTTLHDDYSIADYN